MKIKLLTGNKETIALIFLEKQKKIFADLDSKRFTDNNLFWNSVKPLFSDKQKVRQKIILIEDEDIISDDREVAEKMNEFFINPVSKLGIEDQFTQIDNIENFESIQNILNCCYKDYKMRSCFYLKFINSSLRVHSIIT